MLIVNCTQCGAGRVSMLYATGKALMDAGVISGTDMTPEAALTKLRWGGVRGPPRPRPVLVLFYKLP